MSIKIGQELSIVVIKYLLVIYIYIRRLILISSYALKTFDFIRKIFFVIPTNSFDPILKIVKRIVF